MLYKYILGIDPSGNFYEGKGTTGLCLFDAEKNCILDAKSISAKNYKSWYNYWTAIIRYIDLIYKKHKALTVVIEDYTLYATKAASQINSKMETPKLIGVLQYFCKTNGIPAVLQPAHLVKNRWANPILIHKKYIKSVKDQLYTMQDVRIDRHAVDSIRHAVHYAQFKNKEGVDINEI